MANHSTIEWESDTTRLIQYTGHAKGPNFPLNYRRSAGYRREIGRKVQRIIVHQSAGARREGQEAVDRMAAWITRSPKFAERKGKQRRVGGGRGFPAIPYTFMVPHRPLIQDGKSVVYRLWDDSWVTWHTRRANAIGVGVCFAGSFRTRHDKKFSDDDPTTYALAAGEDLILNYLLPRYNLKPDDLCGHFDYGKVCCPGDALEHWVRKQRGERVSWFNDQDSVELDTRPLRTRQQQNEALAELGYSDYDLNDVDERRDALTAFQEDEAITADGWWGPQSEHAMRLALIA